MPRKFEVYYDPITQQVHVIDSIEKLKLFLDNLSSDVNRLNNAVFKLKKSIENLNFRTFKFLNQKSYFGSKLECPIEVQVEKVPIIS